MRSKPYRHILIIQLLFTVALILWFAPNASAISPGPTEQDDAPPPPATTGAPVVVSLAASPRAVDNLSVPPDLGHEFTLAPGGAIALPSWATLNEQFYAQCLSIGLPHHGALRNGVEFPQDNPYFTSYRTGNQWGTPEAVDGLLYAAGRVRERFGPSNKLVLGDISSQFGGKLGHHKSHQAGRDADVGFFFVDGNPGFLERGTASNLDIPRTWAFAEALIETGSAQMIFVDWSVQEILYNYVKYRLNAPESYLTQVFQYPNRGNRSAIIRHVRGHLNHFHVRFYSPVSVANAVRARYTDSGLAGLQQDTYERMAGRAVELPQAYRTSGERMSYRTMPANSRRITHTVRSGESIWTIARRYNVTVSEVRQWNNLGSSARLRVGQKLVIYGKKKPHAL